MAMDFTDPFTMAMLQSMQGSGGGRGLDTGVQRGMALSQALSQKNLIDQASDSIAQNMQFGMPFEKAMMKAFITNPHIMVEHPELFQNVGNLRNAFYPKLIEKQPGTQMVNAGTGDVVTPSEGAANSGKMTFVTTPDGQTIAVQHDLSGSPSHITNLTAMKGQEAEALARAAEATSAIPKNQAETTLTKAKAGFYGAGNNTTGTNPLDAYVDSIGNYTQKLPTSGSEFGDMVRGKVAMKYPDYDETNWDAKHQVVKDYNNLTTSTSTGAKLRTLNALVSTHLPAIQEYIDAMRNGNVQQLNQAKNKLAASFGNSNVTNLDTASQLVGSEIMNYLQGARSGEAERIHAAAHFSDKMSPDQLQGNLGVINDFLYGQAKAIKQPAVAVGAPQLFDKHLTGETKAWFDKHEGQPALAPLGAGGSSSQNQAPQLPGVGQSVTINGVPVTRIK